MPCNVYTLWGWLGKIGVKVGGWGNSRHLVTVGKHWTVSHVLLDVVAVGLAALVSRSVDLYFTWYSFTVYSPFFRLQAFSEAEGLGCTLCNGP